MAPGVPTDTMAIWSAICAGLGVVGFFCFCIPGIILGAVAFFLGNASINRIRSSAGRTGGQSLAQIGRIGGAIVAVVSLLGLVLLIINALVNGQFTNTTG
jgi:hypothetical protein